MKWFGNKNIPLSETPLPDVPLRDIEIVNPVTGSALDALFADGAEEYMLYYRAFLAMASDDIELLREADKYDAIIPAAEDFPSSYETLYQVCNLRGELGTLVRNAITFAVSITSGPRISRGDSEGLAYIWDQTKPKKSFDEYRAEVYKDNPRSAAIAEAIAAKRSSRLAQDTVSFMGYLVSASNEMAKQNDNS